MQLDDLPELDDAFKKSLWKKMPKKGRFKFWRSLRYSHNVSAGSLHVQYYFKMIANTDLVFDLLEPEVRGDFFWEKGIGSTACQSERIFLHLCRHRRKGDLTLKVILLDEYLKLRNGWLATYHPTAQKAVA